MKKTTKREAASVRDPDVAYRRCVRCGYFKSEHCAVNYSDGQHVTGVVLVCPTATFRQQEGA